jgi:hypothetical protein
VNFSFRRSKSLTLVPGTPRRLNFEWCSYEMIKAPPPHLLSGDSGMTLVQGLESCTRLDKMLFVFSLN